MHPKVSMDGCLRGWRGIAKGGTSVIRHRLVGTKRATVSATMDTCARDTLPEDLLRKVEEGDPKRFRACLRVLERMERDGSMGTNKHASADLARSFDAFLECKRKQDPKDVSRFVVVGLRWMLMIDDQTILQKMWIDVLSSYLRRYKYDLELEIDWRTLCEAFTRRHLQSDKGCYVGISVSFTHSVSFAKLLKRCRKFFAPNAHVEIWQHIESMFSDLPRGDIFGGLLLVVCIFPCYRKNLECSSACFDWDSLLGTWINLMFRLPKCNVWKSAWMAMIARMAKHAGDLLDWEQHVPRLFSSFLNSFEFPLGNADGHCPLSISPPVDRRSLLNYILPNSQSTSIAKVIVYSMKDSNSIDQKLTQLSVYLEQFSHPSNVGQWSPKIASFLDALSFYARKQWRHRRYGRNPPSLDVERNIYAIITRLASRALFSKSKRLSKTAGQALASAAYIYPESALPIARRHFEEALDSATAGTHLADAILMMAYCVRPMLLASDAGSYSAVPNEEFLEFTTGMDTSDDGSKVKQTQDLAQNWLALAMGSIMHGIDANDGPKTSATFKFFIAVFSSVSTMESFPLDWEAWSDAVLSQLFGMLSTLDLPSEAGQHGSSSFLLDHASEYPSFCWLFFQCMPVEAGLTCLGHLRRFLMQEPLNSVAEEVGILLAGAVRTFPAEACGQVLKPLAEFILGLFPTNAVDSDFQEISRATETSLSFYLTVLGLGLVPARDEGILPNLDLFETVAKLGLQSSSRAVIEAASEVLASLLYTLTSFEIQLGSPMLSGTNPGTNITAQWFTRDTPLRCFQWQTPSKEGIAVASCIVTAHLKSAISQLMELMCSEGSSDRIVKLRIMQSLFQVNAVGSGVDFSCNVSDHPLPELGEQLNVVGMQPNQIAPDGIWEDVMATLLKLSSWLSDEGGQMNGDSAEVLALVSHVYRIGLFPGDIDSRSVVLQVPRLYALDKMLLACVDRSKCEGKTHKPLWLLADEAHSTFIRRLEVSRDRDWMRENLLDPPIVKGATMALLDDLYRLSLHRYKSISRPAHATMKRAVQKYPRCVGWIIPLIIRDLRLTAQEEDSKDQSDTASRVSSCCSLIFFSSIAQYLAFEHAEAAKLASVLLDCEAHDDSITQNKVMMCFSALVTNLDGESWDRNGPQGPAISHELKMLRLKAEKALEQTNATLPSSMHWRYIVMSNALLSASVPAHTHDKQVIDEAIKLARHFSNVLAQTDIPILRHIALGGLLLLLGQGLVENQFESGVAAAVRDVFSCPKILTSAVQNLAHSHPCPSSQEEYYRTLSSFRSESSIPASYTADLLGKFMLSSRLWPNLYCCKIVKTSAFCAPYAKFFVRIARIEDGKLRHDLLEAAKELWRNGMKEGHEGMPASEDKLMRVTAAEVMGALINSTSVEDSISNQAANWLINAATESAVDIFDAVLAAMRYAVDGHSPHVQVSRTIMTNAILGSLKTFSMSPSTYLSLSRCLEAANTIACQLPCPGLVDDFKCKVLRECLRLAHDTSAPVRVAAATAAASICEGILQSSNPVGLKAAVNPCRDTDVCQAALEEARRFLDQVEHEGTTAFQKLVSTEAHPENDQAPALQWFEFYMHFLLGIVKADLSPELESFMVRALPSALKALILGESQRELTMTATQVIAYAKYVNLEPLPRAAAAATFASLSSEPVWQIQVASILAGAYFAFRHVFLLEPSEWEVLRREVLLRLEDKKPEVYKCAQEALSGLLRAYSTSDADDLMQRVMSELEHPDVTKRRAAVLAAGSFLMSSPYDVPSWLPPVLIALAGMAVRKQHPSVRDAAVQAVGAFRRTHTELRSDLKHHFTQEQWEEVGAAIPHAHSYFV